MSRSVAVGDIITPDQARALARTDPNYRWESVYRVTAVPQPVDLTPLCNCRFFESAARAMTLQTIAPTAYAAFSWHDTAVGRLRNLGVSDAGSQYRRAVIVGLGLAAYGLQHEVEPF